MSTAGILTDTPELRARWQQEQTELATQLVAEDQLGFTFEGLQGEDQGVEGVHSSRTQGEETQVAFSRSMLYPFSDYSMTTVIRTLPTSQTLDLWEAWISVSLVSRPPPFSLSFFFFFTFLPFSLCLFLLASSSHHPTPPHFLVPNLLTYSSCCLYSLLHLMVPAAGHSSLAGNHNYALLR